MRNSVQLARAIVQDRESRRKWMIGVLLFIVAQVATGTWLIDTWLASSGWIFALYWLSVFGGVCFLLLFALYDMLKAMKGE